MPSVALVWDSALAAYELSPEHPLKPVRLVLAVELMRAYGLLEERAASRPSSEDPRIAAPAAERAELIRPRPATDDELLLVHTAEYVDAVKRASADPAGFVPSHGMGTGDNPVFEGMHEVSSLIVGGGIEGIAAVLDGRCERTFNIAGGLHHAQRDRASGFCVYNDPAVAIAWALREHPDVRVAYVDIDAHHGDGVQNAFEDTDRVLTLSVHESGQYLFPGTGFVSDIGTGAGEGLAMNVPLPPLAGDGCYRDVLERVIAPALRAYRPDILVAQCGCDNHHDDPLTHLALTLPGYRALTHDLFALADEVCDGRVAACGGGGYGVYRTVPRAWTCVLAELLGERLSEELPEAWRALDAEASGAAAPELLTADDEFELSESREAKVTAETDAVIERLLKTHPLLQKTRV